MIIFLFIRLELQMEVRFYLLHVVTVVESSKFDEMVKEDRNVF